MSRRFQFSLKSLMVLVLVVAAFFAGMAIQRRETERMRMTADEARAHAEASAAEARALVDRYFAQLTKAQLEPDDPMPATDGE
jgi:hypothetical protein